MFMLFVFRGGGDTRLEILGTRPMLQNKIYGDNNTTYGANKTYCVNKMPDARKFNV